MAHQLSDSEKPEAERHLVTVKNIFDGDPHPLRVRSRPINSAAAGAVAKIVISTPYIAGHLSVHKFVGCSLQWRVADQASSEKLFRPLYLEPRDHLS